MVVDKDVDRWIIRDPAELGRIPCCLIDGAERGVATIRIACMALCTEEWLSAEARDAGIALPRSVGFSTACTAGGAEAAIGS